MTARDSGKSLDSDAKGGELRADIPAQLAAVIHKALSREAEDRYPDMLAFRQELKRFA